MTTVEDETISQSAKSEDFTGSSGRRVTLQDLARAAGVNVSTVSDALKGTGRVSEATREKVRQIAAQFNYVPNFAARALVTGRTNTIAVVCGDLNQFYYASIVYHLEKLLTAQGYRMLLLRTKAEVHDLVTAAEAAAVDGVIAVDRYHLVDEFLRSDTQIRTCVFIGTYAPAGVDYICVDLSGAVEKSLDAMLALGRKRLAYVVLSEPMAAEDEVRARSYLKVMRREKMRPEIINLKCDFKDVRFQLQNYFEANGAPDGILCQNDETAVFAYRALLDSKLRVPDDVVLVGCDGMPHLECFETPISTIVQPIEEISKTAWAFLQGRIKEPGIALQQMHLETHLVMRESLGGAS